MGEPLSQEGDKVKTIKVGGQRARKIEETGVKERQRRGGEERKEAGGR